MDQGPSKEREREIESDSNKWALQLMAMAPAERNALLQWAFVPGADGPENKINNNTIR